MRHVIMLSSLVCFCLVGCAEKEANKTFSGVSDVIGSRPSSAAKKSGGDAVFATDVDPADIGRDKEPAKSDLVPGTEIATGEKSPPTSPPPTSVPVANPLIPTASPPVPPLAEPKADPTSVKSSDPKEAPKSPPPAVAEAVAGTASRPKKAPEPTPPAGILTAGSFDDNLDPLRFASFTQRFDLKRWQDQLPAKLSGQRVQVLVKDAAGKPVGGARVRLAGGAKSEDLVTRALGQATFVLSWDGLPADDELLVTVTPPGGADAVTEKIPAGAARWEVTLPTSQAKLPKNLDIAIVLDTTGSMGDELRYLVGEMKGIAADIKAKFPEVDQRFGLVLYRDTGDEYVTRHFDFNASIDEFTRNLAKQSAGGGGDYPEAVHKGLETVQQLRWRTDPDTARVVFLIGDAPPQTQYMNDTMKAINILRRQGVAIYPVACSGYDDSCELIWRSAAMLTSSQFLFLTDDSGVGGSHAEPKIPFYQVEHLNKLMVRMVATELRGERVQPLPGDIIRTVGKKIN